MFKWSNVRDDVDTFIKKCIHCLMSNGMKVPRLLAETLRATKPNEVIHFDYLSLPRAETGESYVLVLKDGFSGYVELVPSRLCTTDVVVQALLDWFKRFGVVEAWVSDQGAHFKNVVMTELAKIVGAHHQFSPAYSAWSNGSVEVVNDLLLRYLRSLLSEKRWRITRWPELISITQSALNQLPSPRLGGVAPLTAFTMLKAGDPISVYYATKEKVLHLTELELKEKQKLQLQDMQKASRCYASRLREGD
jgi:transposase InsO family protein